MSFSRQTVLWSVAASVLIARLASGAAADDEAQRRFPLKEHIRGSEALLSQQKACIVIGEIHGTEETPSLAAVLVRSLSTERKVMLCLEISVSEQDRLDAFLESDGGSDAVSALLSGPHWEMPDGRASAGFLKMIQLVRQLKESGRQVNLAAIDDDQTQDELPQTAPTPEQILAMAIKRDRAMADNVLAVVKQNSNSSIVVLVGNIHARTKEGAPWDSEDKSYKPMACCLKETLPHLTSLKSHSSGGQAWVMTDAGVGPRKFPGRDRGGEPFIELYDQPANGYDSLLYLGAIHASPPAKKHTSFVEFAIERLPKLTEQSENEE